jgi:hypothetical protein
LIKHLREPLFASSVFKSANVSSYGNCAIDLPCIPLVLVKFICVVARSGWHYTNGSCQHRHGLITASRRSWRCPSWYHHLIVMVPLSYSLSMFTKGTKLFVKSINPIPY